MAARSARARATPRARAGAAFLSRIFCPCALAFEMRRRVVFRARSDETEPPTLHTRLEQPPAGEIASHCRAHVVR